MHQQCKCAACILGHAKSQQSFCTCVTRSMCPFSAHHEMSQVEEGTESPLLPAEPFMQLGASAKHKLAEHQFPHLSMGLQPCLSSVLFLV